MASSLAVLETPALRPLRRFFKTPKGLTLALLTGLVLLATWNAGARIVAPGLAGALAVSALLDGVILRIREREWAFPSGALITGLIVAMIVSPHERWYVPTVTAGVAVVSKYVFRAGRANVFNPAALGLLATYFVFDTEQTWWGALPDLTPFALVALCAAGIYIADRVNKMPLVLAFLGSYYLLFTGAAFVGNPGAVAELYRAPDLHAALFFAFFMVSDPPTSPPKNRDQVVFGVITAVVSFALFEWAAALYYLLGGVLAANAWEAARRWRAKRMKEASRAAGKR